MKKMNLTSVFWLIILFGINCTKPEPEPTSIDLPTELLLTIDGDVLADTLMAGCHFMNRVTNFHIRALKSEEHEVFHYIGGHDYKDIGEAFYARIHIMDTTQFYPYISTEIIDNYLNGTQEGIVVPEIIYTKEGVSYSNIWYVTDQYTTWDYRVSDENASFNIETEELIRPSCIDSAPMIPVNLSYVGYILNESRTDSLWVDALKLKLFLREI